VVVSLVSQIKGRTKNVEWWEMRLCLQGRNEIGTDINYTVKCFIICVLHQILLVGSNQDHVVYVGEKRNPYYFFFDRVQ
jgi:hypothetical protein